MFELRIREAKDAIFERDWASHIISLVDPRGQWNKLDFGENHLKILMDDVTMPHPMHPGIVPDISHLRQIFEFTKNLTDADRLIIHCHAGISRSTAVALAVLCQHGMEPYSAAVHVYELRRIAEPNLLLVELADELLGFDGELFDAVARVHQTVGRKNAQEANAPLSKPLGFLRLV